MKKLIILAVALLGLASCKKDQELAPDLPKDSLHVIIPPDRQPKDTGIQFIPVN